MDDYEFAQLQLASREERKHQETLKYGGQIGKKHQVGR